MKRVVFALFASSWLTPACAHTTAASGPLVTVSTEAPPPPRAEPAEMRGDDEVRVRGVWLRRGDTWVWRPGHWQRARAGLVWRDAHWVLREGRWHWVEGHWQRER